MTVVINGTTGIDTGTGSLIAADSTTPTYLDLFEDTDNGSNYVRLIAPTSVASNRTITLPDATGTMVVGSAAVSAVGQIPFSTDGSSYTPTAKIVSGTAITLTNQTAPEFTGIPSWAKRVTVVFNEVSTNGTSNILIQLGTGSTPTYTTSGYVSTAFGASGSSAFVANSTSGILVYNAAITYITSGFIQLVNISGNTWIASGAYKNNTNTGTSSAGSIALGAALTAVRLFIDGTQQFDAGSINIIYE